MSVPPDPEDPTRRLPPTEPAQPMREREVVMSDELEPAWVQDMRDRLRSLRAAVALLGVLAVAALGVAVWSLLTQEEEGDAQRGASQERVRDLEQRVEDVESESGDAASRDAVERLRDEQEQLGERLTAVEDRPGGPSRGSVEELQADVTQLSDGVEQLGQSVEDLQQRVDELEQRQSEDTGSP